MLFAAKVLQNPADLMGGFDGGYGFSGQGPRRLRALGVLVLIASVPAWGLTATAVDGPSMGLGTPHGGWGAVLYLTGSACAGAAMVVRTPITMAPPSPRRASHPHVRSLAARKVLRSQACANEGDGSPQPDSPVRRGPAGNGRCAGGTLSFTVVGAVPACALIRRGAPLRRRLS